METKICSKCKEEKDVCEFGNRSNSKDGKSSNCKKCHNLRSADYQKRNYKECLERQGRWRSKNRERVYDRYKKYKEKNPEKIKELRERFYTNNPHKRKEYRENYKPRKHEQRKERRESDPIFTLINNVRSRLYKYLTKLDITKKNKTFDIVGCNPLQLKEHLEKQFVDGMTWENKGDWHIDHIIPLSSAKTEDELYKLCHYTNLQPLWAIENIKKGKKILSNNLNKNL
jgi:transketolase